MPCFLFKTKATILHVKLKHVISKLWSAAPHSWPPLSPTIVLLTCEPMIEPLSRRGGEDDGGSPGLPLEDLCLVKERLEAIARMINIEG